MLFDPLRSLLSLPIRAIIQLPIPGRRKRRHRNPSVSQRLLFKTRNPPINRLQPLLQIALSFLLASLSTTLIQGTTPTGFTTRSRSRLDVFLNLERKSEGTDVHLSPPLRRDDTGRRLGRSTCNNVRVPSGSQPVNDLSSLGSIPHPPSSRPSSSRTSPVSCCSTSPHVGRIRILNS